MQNLTNAFKITVIFSFYLSVGSVILLILVWLASDSVFTFLEILFYMRKPVFRLFTGGLLVITLIPIMIYVTYSKQMPVLPCSIFCSIRLVFNSLPKKKNEIFDEDFEHITKLASMLLIVIVGIFLMEYLIEGVIWREALLQAILFILPITIGLVPMFLFFVPSMITIFSLGDFIKRNFD